MKPKLWIIIPCYNEELTIEKVIKDFKKELPEAEIYVYDNNSKDKTAQIAEKNGAIVRYTNHSKLRGEGSLDMSGNLDKRVEQDILTLAQKHAIKKVIFCKALANLKESA